MSDKCYAWQPGNPDNICRLREGHFAPHQGYDWQEWPRRTKAAAQSALDRLNEMEPIVNGVIEEMRLEAIFDGRHDVAEELRAAIEDYYRGLRYFRLAAVRWRNQLPEDTPAPAEPTEPILRPTDQRAMGGFVDPSQPYLVGDGVETLIPPTDRPGL